MTRHTPAAEYRPPRWQGHEQTDVQEEETTWHTCMPDDLKAFCQAAVEAFKH